MHQIEFKVNSQIIKTIEHELTPVQIMGLAHIDPQTNYLVQIKGHEQISYQGKPEEEIHLHEHMVFITVSIGPTPVSLV